MSAIGDALDRLREFVRPEWRERIYDTVGAAVVLLGGWGLVDQADGAVIAQVILAAVALLFAILHSTSGIRTALYGLLVAVQAVFGLWSIGTDAQWAGVLAIAAAVLGTQVAAGRTPILDNARAAIQRVTAGSAVGITTGKPLPEFDLAGLFEDMRIASERARARYRNGG